MSKGEAQTEELLIKDKSTADREASDNTYKGQKRDIGCGKLRLG